MTFENQTVGRIHVFHHKDGLNDYLRLILANRHATQVHEVPFALTREHEATSSRLELVLLWTESTDEHLRSYVNGIPTGSGGTHESGFRSGIGKAIRNFIDTHDLIPKGLTLTTEDIREGTIGVLSIFLPEPQFQGQTKDRLSTAEAGRLVEQAIRDQIERIM